MKILISLFLLVALQVQMTDAQDQKLAPAIAKWEKDIVKLEERNDSEPQIANAVLYCGSSSIRRWATVATDMAPWPAISRGYGGAKLPDLIHYAPRILGPHLGEDNPNRCRAIVIFVANDINGKAPDATPEEVTERFSRLHQWVREQDSTVPIFWIEVTPTGKRWGQWPDIAEATERIGQIIDTDDNTHLIETAGAFLGVDGRPRPELFVKDQLHLSEAGYQQWATLIKAQLHAKLGAVKAWEAVPEPQPVKPEPAPDPVMPN